MPSRLSVSRRWVFLRRGHCVGVLPAGGFPSEAGAWREMYPSEAWQGREAAAPGVCCVKVDDDEYARRWSLCQLRKCYCDVAVSA